MPDKNIPNRAVIDVDEQLLNDISDLIHSKSDVLLNNILADIYPADIALIINNLDDELRANVLDRVGFFLGPAKISYEDLERG